MFHQVLITCLSSSLITVMIKRWGLLVDPANYRLDLKTNKKLHLKRHGDIFTHNIDLEMSLYR